MERSAAIKIAGTLAATLPAIVMRLGGIHAAPIVEVIVFGVAVVSTAFLLAWAAEAAQLDISGGLAIAILALIAVLPEYAVDLYFSYTAGTNPEHAQYAAANMTGSNRLLIGFGWPLVAFVAFYAFKKRKARDTTDGTTDGATDGATDEFEDDGSVTANEIRLPENRRIDIGFLAVASAYAFVIPLTRKLAWYDSVFLLGLFGLYLWRLTREPQSEPELIGVSQAIGDLPQRKRRVVVVTLFLVSAAIILLSAEPFAEGLVDAGKTLGIDEFLLVQWLAPLASEAPELIIACLFAWRLRAGDALGTLLSSKVNQWTLLVGTIPLAYLAGGGSGHGLTLDARQHEEFLLTSAQALLALMVIIDLRFSRRDAILLFGLFVAQFPFPQTGVRLAFSAAYMACAVWIGFRNRHAFKPTIAAVLGRRPPDYALADERSS